MAATKFTEAEREKLFAQLEAPFDPALIKWRVMRTCLLYTSGKLFRSSSICRCRERCLGRFQFLCGWKRRPPAEGG